MKLENGTVLEVGKKYCFKDPQAVVRPITITAIGREYVLGIDSLAVEHLGRVFEQMWKISYDWIPYEEEKKERWYEILVDQDPEGTIKQFTIWYCTAPTIGNEVLRQWDSKEEMIKDLKKG